MDKTKFYKAKCDLRDLLNVETEIYFGGKHTDIADGFNREIVKAARELLAAAGEDIIGTPTPAGIKEYPSGKREFVCTKLSYRDPNATAHTD